MSAQFILEYAGLPIRFTAAGPTPCQESAADKFIAEPDAWHTAHANGLNPARCRVVNLYERNLESARGDSASSTGNCPTNANNINQEAA